MTAPRDALAQLEAVLELAEAGRVDQLMANEFWPEWAPATSKFFAASINFMATHAKTLRALLGAADGVDARDAARYRQIFDASTDSLSIHYELPDVDACRVVMFKDEADELLDQLANATLTKAPAND